MPPWCCPIGKTFPTGWLFSQPDLEENSMVRFAGGKTEGGGLQNFPSQ